MGSYAEWDEEKRIEFLTRELEGKRPLVPPAMPMTNDVREVCTSSPSVATLMQCTALSSSPALLLIVETPKSSITCVHDCAVYLAFLALIGTCCVVLA